MANLGGVMRSSSRIVEEFVPYSGWTEDAKAHHLLIDLPDFNKEDVKLHIDSQGQMIVGGERKVNEEKYVYFEQTFTVPENTVVDQISGKFDGEFLYVTVPKQAVVEEEIEYVDHGMISTAQENEHEKPTNYENELGKPTNYENELGKPTNYENELGKPTNYENELGKPTNYDDKLSSRDDRHQHGNIHGSRQSEEEKGNSHLGFPEENIRKWENESIIILRMVVNMVKRNKGIVITALLAFSLGVLVSRLLYK
ncbi:uncharacterized protein LOC132173526 [Corylus avellana]|uniref:uncharacterized protein LOC132173526 n=1 Tax=Corylus avellana TaxID=13451 RepID=UPI00286BF477|nr:uncharacterized protein LOC132173526 [Corylus avellana]